MYANQLRRLLETLGPGEDLPTEEMMRLYTPPAGGFVRREDTGETLFTNGQPGGIFDKPTDFTTPDAGGMPGGAPPMQPSRGSVMRVLGYGNGQVTELPPERGDAEIDQSRAPIDIPGVGRGYYSKDGRSAIVTSPGGLKTKVLLGYDAEGSMRLNALDLARRKGEAEIEHTNAATEQIGAPNYQLTPEGDVFNPKTGQIERRSAQAGAVDRQRRQAEYASGLKQVEKDDAAVAQSSDLLADLQRWQELNAKTMTGPVVGHRPGIFNEDLQELRRLENKLATSNYKPGQGSISNFERGLIKGAGPMTTNDEGANKNIVSIMAGGIQNMKDRANFREAYLQARGNLLGSDQAWQEYLDANPRYTRDGKGNIVPNGDRAEWQAWFSGGKAAESSRTAAAEPVKSFNGSAIPQAAIDALKADPGRRTDFDRKYGPGSAARVLKG